MTEWIVSILIILGSLFMLIAAVGILLLRDVYMRMHAITKASSLSIVFFLIAVVVYDFNWGTLASALLVLVFIVSTAPIASHMIARVAHIMGIPMSKGVVMDQIAEDQKANEDTGI